MPKLATTLSSINRRCLKTVVRLQEECGWGRRKKAPLPEFPEHTAWQSETLSSIDNAPKATTQWETFQEIVNPTWTPNQQMRNAMATTCCQRPRLSAYSRFGKHLKKFCEQNPNTHGRTQSQETWTAPTWLVFRLCPHVPARCSGVALCNDVSACICRPQSFPSHIVHSGTERPSHPGSIDHTMTMTKLCKKSDAKIDHWPYFFMMQVPWLQNPQPAEMQTNETLPPKSAALSCHLRSGAQFDSK